MKLLKKIKKLLAGQFFRLAKYKELKKKNYIINFSYEGNVKIKTPKLSIKEVFFDYGIYAKRSFRLMSRPFSEILLRKECLNYKKSLIKKARITEIQNKLQNFKNKTKD